MIDPKMVELSGYSALPHLRHPVIVDNSEAADVLRWVVDEMNDRYALMHRNRCRHLLEFNARVREGAPLVQPVGSDVALGDLPYVGGAMPYLVVIIDELADLMMTVQQDVERPLALLAQKSRAVGIHLIVATQRPSVNVLTGVIKANFPSRIGFRVASAVDSRTILDGIGAEVLLGQGDMLYVGPGASEPMRAQGAFVSSADLERLVRWYEEHPTNPWPKEADILQVVKQRKAAEQAGDVPDRRGAGQRDDLFRDAAEVCLRQGSASTSLLQRKLEIGYGRAARLMDQLEEAGVIGPSDGPARARPVLMSAQEITATLGGS
jgi:S-DNA-T family DNA segregation ATPase FtsK/SpoIIIE